MTDAPVPIRVLLVEDNPTDQKLVQGLLRHASEAAFEVVVAQTMAEALAHLARGSFDVTLLDLELPDSRGLDTFFALRNSAGDTPTVVLTGSDEADIGRRAVQAGAQDFLVKGGMESRRLSEALLYTIERWHQSETGALYDPLTGLATKKLLAYRLTEALGAAERQGDTVAVVSVHLDLRGGKHDRKTTEEILTVVSGRLRRALRPFDILARTGTDTFAAVVGGLARPVNAERAGQRVLSSLIGEVTACDESVRLVARVGVAVGRRAADADQLLAQAQSAAAQISAAQAPAMRLAT